MKETTQQLFDRTVDAIEAADILLTNGKTDIAAGRAYYAMFYIAEALLYEKGHQFGKHGNVLAAYGQHFAKRRRWIRNTIAGCLHRLTKDRLETMHLIQTSRLMWLCK